MLVKFLKAILLLIPVSLLSACNAINSSGKLGTSSQSTLLKKVDLLNQEINIPIGSKEVFWITNNRKLDYTLDIDVTFGRPIDIYLFKSESDNQSDSKPEIIQSFKQVKKIIDNGSLSEGTYGLFIAPRGPLECLILAPEKIGLDKEKMEKLNYFGFEGVYWNDISHSRGGINFFGFGSDPTSSEEIGKNILPSETQSDIYMTLKVNKSQIEGYSIERKRNQINNTASSDSFSRCYNSELDIPKNLLTTSEEDLEPSSPTPESSEPET